MNIEYSLKQVLRSAPVVAAAVMPLSALGQMPPSVVDTRLTLLPPGPLSTKGNQIIDQKSRNVRLACVGWNQMHEHISLEVQTRLMARHGFNCIRFSWVNATMHKDLKIIDRVVAAASKAGLRLVLDNHTNNLGHGERDNWGAQQKNGLWYDLSGASDGTDGGGNPGTTTDEKFLADWQHVARHYAGNQTIIGYDLRNEPLAWPGMSVWGGDSNRDIRAMYIRVGNAIQAIDPDKLIIVELLGGPPDCNCRDIRKYPVTLNVPNKLVYSVHEYPSEISGIKVDSGPGLIRRMDEEWGWIVNTNLAPVFIGEMGASMSSARSKAWAATVVPYFNGTGPHGLHIGAGGQGLSTDWWVWGHLEGQNPNGTLQADWKTPRPEQEAVYAKLRQRPIDE
jgi:endoglucanase